MFYQALKNEFVILLMRLSVNNISQWYMMTIWCVCVGSVPLLSPQVSHHPKQPPFPPPCGYVRFMEEAIRHPPKVVLVENGF